MHRMHNINRAKFGCHLTSFRYPVVYRTPVLQTTGYRNRLRGVQCRASIATRQQAKPASRTDLKDGSVLFTFDDVANVPVPTYSRENTVEPATELIAGDDLWVHFVGIGGAGLSALAYVALKQGMQVSGSDMASNQQTKLLAQEGAKVWNGHSAEHVAPAAPLSERGVPDVVVASSAIPKTNPELVAARNLGVPVLSRAAWLGRITSCSDLIAVAGSHGKTTTSALLAWLLEARFPDAVTAVVGASVPHFPSAGGGLVAAEDEAVFILEADEYDGAFLQVKPLVAVVTNVEWEHVDVYPSPEAVQAAFEAFAGQVRPGGVLLACGDDPGAAALAESFNRHAASEPASALHVITYGLHASNTWSVEDCTCNKMGGMDFQVTWCGMQVGAVRTRLPGMHNVLNTLAAIAASALLPPSASSSSSPLTLSALASTTHPLHTGTAAHPEPSTSAQGRAEGAARPARAPGEDLREQACAAVKRAAQSLVAYGGVRRRFDLLGQLNGCAFVDDYAHHPTEVRATLRAARDQFPESSIWAVFQPHTYSRLGAFFDSFCTAFEDADRVFITEVFGAREEASRAAGAHVRTGADLAAHIRQPPAIYTSSLEYTMDRVMVELHMDGWTDMEAAYINEADYVDDDDLEDDAEAARGGRRSLVVIFMGAGDVNTLAPEMIDRLATVNEGGSLDYSL